MLGETKQNNNKNLKLIGWIHLHLIFMDLVKHPLALVWRVFNFVFVNILDVGMVE